MSIFFITGIGTDVGKTVVSAIVVNALKADYWKPIQAGDLENTDTHTVQNLVTSKKSHFHRSAYSLNTPMSPHAAAAIDNVQLRVRDIKTPSFSNDHLVIEGAGGLLVPLNEKETIRDLIQPEYKIILVSRNYLGSINHTLMSIEVLKNSGLTIAGVIFNGPKTTTTETIIPTLTGVKVLGRIEEEEKINAQVIDKYASLFEKQLKNI